MIRSFLSNRRANSPAPINSLNRLKLSKNLPLQIDRPRRFLPSRTGLKGCGLPRRRASPAVGALLAHDFLSLARRQERNAMQFNGLNMIEGAAPRHARQISPGKAASCRSCFAERAGED
ncbi:hypothetical protein [Caulobacter sp. LARHSG274]